MCGRLVAELIADAGLDRFYRQRSAFSPRPDDDNGSMDDAAVFDDPELTADFVTPVRGEGESLHAARLLLSGVSCAACTWLIERALQRLDGVARASVNLAHQRLDVCYDSDQVALSQLVFKVRQLGYKVRPYRDSTRRTEVHNAQREALRRLGVAGIGMMQVGMIAIALYAGEATGMMEPYRDLLRWVSAVFATVVVGYSAAGFFSSAWRHLRHGALVMDLPVALAIGIAYSASVWATLRGEGVVYYDSVVMFTFLLLLGRYLEQRSRQRLALVGDDIEDCLPDTCTRLGAEGWETVPRTRVAVGDRVLVASGSTLGIDGRIGAGTGSVNQASIDGEQLPRSVGPGDPVYAGSINLEGSIEIEVTTDPARTRLATLRNSLEQATAIKPSIAHLADRVAA